ncbi:MAG: exodeoxyribonuclease VII large subunit [Luminiphilus sp.]|nr:exodeoxyribonuclease VII large subunit [Luminiphilus sp.]
MIDINEKSTTISVSELTQRAKSLLEGHFARVDVEGEISDFTAASSGHWYFTLKDSESQVRCAMFRSANAKLRFKPSRGDRVQIRARVSLYTNRGEFQLIAQHIQPAGDGALQQAFDKLKAKLFEEGLFAVDRKQPVPNSARRIGVVTSPSGAALHDILAVLGRRSPMTDVFLFPVPVQGTDAPEALVQAVNQANALHQQQRLPLDVLIIGRGGGSAEDLWAFNDESLARAIANSELPIVSAVGHEVDFSISDFVADQRAATPSAAAELVSLDQSEWSQRLDDAQRILQGLMARRLNQERSVLGHWQARLRHPGSTLKQQRQLLESRKQQLSLLMGNRLRLQQSALTNLNKQVKSRHPRTGIEHQTSLLSQRKRELQQLIQGSVRRFKGALEQQEQLIRTLGPENTLARGYALVTGPDGQIIRSAEDAPPQTKVRIRLAKDELAAQVITASTPKNGASD